MDKQSLEELLRSLLRAGASSLHLLPGRAPCMRLQRRFVNSAHEPLSATQIDELTRDFLFADHRQALRRDGAVEVLYVAGNGRRFRTAVTAVDDGLAVVMRPIAIEPPTIEDLDLPPQLGDLTGNRNGLVLVGGFFGAGKSSTMAAMIDRCNRESSRMIVTLEESIEYLHPPAAALLLQREVGSHVASYAEGIDQAARVGAQLIAVGDVRDLETLEAAMAAAAGGSLVLAGVEASAVTGVIERVLALSPDDQRQFHRVRLARVLRAVTAQTLVQNAKGDGRVPMVEILIMNDAARLSLRKGAIDELPAIMRRCRGLGMQTQDVALQDLLARHLIGAEDARRWAGDPVGTGPNSVTSRL